MCSVRRRPTFPWTVSRRFSLLLGLAVLVSFLAAGLPPWLASQAETAKSLAKMRTLLLDIRDTTLRQQVEAVCGALEAVAQRRDAGQITDREARKLGAELLRSARYGRFGYFWADDYEGRNVVLLGSSTEGTLRWDAQDVQGRYYIRDLNRAGRQPGGGFVDYAFPRPGEAKPVAKRGYALAFEPFQWVVGTGDYTDDIEALVESRALEAHQAVRDLGVHYATGLVIVMVLILVLVGIARKRILHPLDDLHDRLDALAAGDPDLNTVLTARSRDDIAELIGSFNRFLLRYRGVLQRQEGYRLLTEKLALLAEAHDPGTAAHTVRVGRLSAFLAHRWGLSDPECEALEGAAALHDIGKLFLDPQILNKAGALDPLERKELQRHTVYAARLLDGASLSLERDVAVHHHERFDGSGYPDGLKGDEIPLPAQLVGAADVYDALRSARPYKDPLTPEQALRIMTDGDGKVSGGGFNPALLRILRENLDEIEARFYGASVAEGPADPTGSEADSPSA